MPPEGERTVLFYRDLRKFHGGHLKVWDYFNHVRAAPGYEPLIDFSEKTSWKGSDNPWAVLGDEGRADYDSVAADAFFVAGRDWERMDGHPRGGAGLPVINLVQGLRHADPASTRYEYLSRPAIRICVSEEVREALLGTGVVAGPILTVPNGLDLESLPHAEPEAADIDVMIAGIKHPERARKLAEMLAGADRRVLALTQMLPRNEFLDTMKRARVSLFLPLAAEGFYLPPLEGMTVGTLVVCPEHRGPRSLYRDGVNCFYPRDDDEAVVAAIERALGLESASAQRMRDEARAVANRHDLSAERSAFQAVLGRLDELWAEARGR